MGLKQTLKKNTFVWHLLRFIKRNCMRFLYTDYQFKNRFYKRTHGRYPNWNSPQSYTEKMLWSSENYRDDRFVWYADKYLVRNHISKTIGSEYLIPLYDVVDDEKKLDFSKYPKRFVLNATHGSNMVVLCQDKDKFDIKSALSKCKEWLHTNYYEVLREWHYNFIKPRILVLENISTKEGLAPWDYKFFCFNGVPYVVALDLERFGTTPMRNVYDMDWKQIENVRITRPQDFSRTYPKPENFEKMKELATILANGFEHVRVDFYNVDGKIYFGELTFLHSAAGLTGNITPWEFDLELGSHYCLPPRNIDNWQYKGENINC